MNTTREKAKKMIHNDQTQALQNLLQKNYDAESGFKKAMKLAEKDRTIEFLKQKAAEKSEFTNEINHEIRKLNEDPIDSGSTKASMHRVWMDAKALVSGSTDEKVLEECIRGEKASIEEYKEILRNQTFSPETTKMLSNHVDQIEITLRELKRKEKIEEVLNS